MDYHPVLERKKKGLKQHKDTFLIVSPPANSSQGALSELVCTKFKENEADESEKVKTQ